MSHLQHEKGEHALTRRCPQPQIPIWLALVKPSSPPEDVATITISIGVEDPQDDPQPVRIVLVNQS